MCIGEKIDTSILTTLNVISMGVPRVISKAISAEHGSVLERIGAEVIFPERDMAIRLANRLVSSRALDFITLNDDITVSELKLTSKISGKTVVESNIRKKFKLNIIAIEQSGKTKIDITADSMLNEGDLIVVVGKRENIKNFEEYLEEV